MEKENFFIVFNGVTIFKKYIVSFSEHFNKEKKNYFICISTTSFPFYIEEEFESEAKALDRVKELADQMDKKFLLIPYSKGFIVADKISYFLMLKNNEQPQGFFHYTRTKHYLGQKNNKTSYFLLIFLDGGASEILLSFSNEEDMKAEFARIKEKGELSKKLFSLHNAELVTEKIADLSIYKNSDLGIKSTEIAGMDDRYFYFNVGFFSHNFIIFRYDTREEAEKDKERIIEFNSKF